ncbi:MAG TPA: hypothetical protein VK152_02080 [Paludibacter sp.]|nr:hypothetical protein [Paludibacter sp.]
MNNTNQFRLNSIAVGRQFRLLLRYEGAEFEFANRAMESVFCAYGRSLVVVGSNGNFTVVGE